MKNLTLKNHGKKLILIEQVDADLQVVIYSDETGMTWIDEVSVNSPEMSELLPKFLPGKSEEI